MKNKTSGVLSIIAILLSLIALIFVLAKKPQKSVKPVKSTSVNLKIAYVKLDTLLNNYDLYNSLMIQYMKKEQTYQKELQSKALSIQQRSMKLQNDYSKGLITSASFQQKMQKLQNEQQGIQQWYNQKQQELANDQNMITQRVMDSLNSAIREFNKDQRYKFIFLKSAMLYGDTLADVTDTLVNLMNAKLQTNK